MFVRTYPLYRAKIVQTKRKSKGKRIYLNISIHHLPIFRKSGGFALYISKKRVTKPNTYVSRYKGFIRDYPPNRRETIVTKWSVGGN